MQTELSTDPDDVLAYVADPSALVHAAVSNAMRDLQLIAQSCLHRVEGLLDTNGLATNWRDDLCVVSTGVDGLPIKDDLEHNVQMDVRLCGLRLRKLEESWRAIVDEAVKQNEELCGLSHQDEEYYSDFVDDCIALCSDIDQLSRSQHTVGIYACGLSVMERFEHTITKREGIQATLDYMKYLGIESDGMKCGVLTLALKMLLNNRCTDG